MTYLRKPDYNPDRVRPNVLTHYVAGMKTFLELKYPDQSPEKIDAFVKATVRERFKSPNVHALIHPSEGNTQEADMRLDHYVRDIIRDNNISPSGTCYHPVSRKEAFLRITIDGKVKERNAFKKQYLGFESQGLKREAQYYYQNQANAKIFNNAIAGGMGTRQFILGCKAGFNAITSVGRMSVKQGYSIIERALNSNIYLPTVRDAISYTLNHLRHTPAPFQMIFDQGILYQPSVDQVVDYLMKSVQNYTNQLDDTDLRIILTNTTNIGRAYVFYAGCLNNVCRFNERLMKDWIDSCYLPERLDPSLYQDIDLDDIKKYPEDIRGAVLSTNYKRLGRRPDKPEQWNSLKDAVKNNPEGLKEFIYCVKHFDEHYQKQLDLLKAIFQIETTFSRLTFQDKIARYTVPLSDTDSNIFSTQELIRWKTGKIDFSQTSYEMNAIVVLILSQALEHVFARLSAGFGVEAKDAFRISMKNEFLYPVAIITAGAKHYIAIATMQEGSLLPTPRKDIKGVGLRSSAYPKLVRDAFDAFCVDLIAEIQKGEPIRAGYIFDHVTAMEKKIFDSVTSCASDYLQTVSVRVAEDYSDPESSNYFYYELWQSVFADEMGEMVLPNKCYKIPLKTGAKLFRNEAFMNQLQASHPSIHSKLVAFMEKNKGRAISMVYVPPSKGPINKLFVEMMDIRAHISQIMMGYYHLIASIGVGTPDPAANALVSDFYDPSSQLLE